MSGGIKRTPADAAFSDCVRMRAAGKCEKSGIEFPGADLTGKSKGLECAHVYGRRAKSTRWHPWNAFSLSSYSHRYFTENPDIFMAWVQEQLGQTRFEALRSAWLENVKVNNALEKQIAAHYRRQLRLMQDIRKAGWPGRIEFVDWRVDADPYIPQDTWREAMREDA